MTVDREGGSGEGGSPQRAFVHPRAGIADAAKVAPEHLDIGHHVVAPGHRLCGLEVCEAGHDPVGSGLGLPQQRLDQRQQPGFGGIELVADPEAEIGRHLVVARARGVQAACGFADQGLEPGLDVHVDVFQRGGKLEAARFDL